MTRPFCVGALAILAVFAAAGSRARTQTQPGSPIVFENVSDAAGLSFVLDQHPTPEKNMVETMAGGLAVFDYDGDGLPDIFFTNGAPLPALRKESPKDWNRLFRNLGGLRFTDVTEAAGVRGDAYATGAAAGDYDNDGRVDLFVAGVQRNQLLRNIGGRFQDVTAASGIKSYPWSVAAGWFDYDNDGWLDLFIVNYVNWTPETNKSCTSIAANSGSSAMTASPHSRFALPKSSNQLSGLSTQYMRRYVPSESGTSALFAPLTTVESPPTITGPYSAAAYAPATPLVAPTTAAAPAVAAAPTRPWPFADNPYTPNPPAPGRGPAYVE